MISVIIPAYKNTEELIKNLRHNLRFLKDCQVIVVNDNPDKSLSEYLSEFPEIKLIEHTENLGFGATVNHGVKEANNPYVMLLNSDVVLNDSYFKKAISHFKNDKELFAVGFAQREKNGDIVGKNRIFFSHGFLQHSKARDLKPGITAWAEGGACLVDRAKFLHLQGFDGLFAPFYWEDIDLSYNAWKAGFKILFDPTVLVEHHHESTIGKYFQPTRIKLISYRNQYLFIWKNMSDLKICLTHAFYLVPMMILFLIKGEPAFLLAFLQAVIRLPEVIMRKKNQRSRYKKTDSEVLSLFI